MSDESHSPSYPQPGACADISSDRLAVLKRRVPHLFGSQRHSRRSKRLAISAPLSPSSLSNVFDPFSDISEEMSHDESHRFSAPASLPASGASAHSESYEGSLDMTIVPSPGLRERTNMPMPPPSPRGRDAKAKEDVGSHTSPASGRTSPASSTRHHASRSGSRMGAAGPSRARDAEQPLTEVGHSPVVRDGVSFQSLELDFPGLPQQLQEAFARERRKLMKEREELARERHKREMCELEVKSLQTLLEMEKEGRAKEVKWLQASTEKEADFFKALLEEKDRRLQEKDRWLQEKDRWLQEKNREKDDWRESVVSLYKETVAILKERCEVLEKKVQAASTGKPL